MSQTAFVTGASGFVGAALVRELHQQGWEIHVLARPTASLKEIEDVPVTVHTGNLVEAESLRDALPANTNAVFHVAASTNFWSRHNDIQSRINVDGTRHMLEAAVAARAGRFIHTSSFVTWGFQDKVITENSPRVDTSDWINYVRTKHLSEQLVLEAVDRGRMDAAILNPANVLGPGDWRNWSRLFRLIHRKRLPAAPPGGGSFCDVREVARAHIRAFHAAPAGEKYLLGGEYSTIMDVIRIAGEILDKPVPSRTTPAWLLKSWAHFLTGLSSITGREPDITPETAVMASHEIVCDSGKALRELDYAFTPVPDLVRDTIAWMKAKGLLS
jgi:nucleoside-diphosphate-sugar epimerase